MSKQSVKKSQRGQGMTEYIVIVALIAVAAIATYQFFGQTVRTQTAGMAQELAGRSAQQTIRAAGDNAQQAVQEGNRAKGLNAYNNEAAR
ncbi:hypothetical protein GTZ97_03705 [Aquabacterium fontiphilum]|uniref:hypothetical protein n=1 Tax=Aquabacterium fontiphilum TaxID=450365 RepID=UPI001377FEE3|nr:hypothetical protein [Aquabacterium fontiphilum]NBD19776.1 hypothetical protein [Aquabacterium fontiphilum]